MIPRVQPARREPVIDFVIFINDYWAFSLWVYGLDAEMRHFHPMIEVKMHTRCCWDDINRKWVTQHERPGKISWNILPFDLLACSWSANMRVGYLLGRGAYITIRPHYLFRCYFFLPPQVTKQTSRDDRLCMHTPPPPHLIFSSIYCIVPNRRAGRGGIKQALALSDFNDSCSINASILVVNIWLR